MTSTELRGMIREKLEVPDLLRVIDEHKSQFLEFPEGLFAELVVKDGSKQVEVEAIAQETRERLREQKLELEVVVRSLWAVAEVHFIGAARAVSGGIRAAGAYAAALVSGSAQTTVEVDVTYLAQEEIRRRLAQSMQTGAMGKDDGAHIIEDVVTEFLKLSLSLGGESYWDPIRYPQRELNESALLYLLGHSPVGQVLQRIG